MKYWMKYLLMSNEILNEIPTNEQWDIWWNKCHGEWNSMKYLPMSNEIFDEISAMENEIFNEIPANAEWNIQWNTYQWAMK